MAAEVSEEEVKRPPVSNKKLGLFSPAPFRPEVTEQIKNDYENGCYWY